MSDKQKIEVTKEKLTATKEMARRVLRSCRDDYPIGDNDPIFGEIITEETRRKEIIKWAEKLLALAKLTDAEWAKIWN